MKILEPEARAHILHLLCEGNSIRAVTRLTGASKNTVIKLMIDAGKACAAYHDDNVRNLRAERIQVDEIWSFVYSKNLNVKQAKAAPFDAGDVWTWTAIDADTKLIATWYVGDRTTDSARIFLGDLKDRVSNRMQLTSDGHRPYLKAVEHVFGDEIDYAVLHKIYGPDRSAGHRYSPPVCVGAELRKVVGCPDPEHISTSYAERQNLTMRMHMRRFTRLTNAFSKKVENHAFAVALHMMYYNFVRLHSKLRMSPAMAAGVSDRLWDVGDIVALVEAEEAKINRKRGPYKKRLG